MSDFGDDAGSLQERLLAEALKRRGITPREIVIPPPRFEVAAKPSEKEMPGGLCAKACSSHVASPSISGAGRAVRNGTGRGNGPVTSAGGGKTTPGNSTDDLGREGG